ncbi:ORF2a [Actinidia yellowing ringspot virus]|uniref:RNA-directed RNA polymerase 2a n=1 Tax=Actinidia yellowing ringspot virus TaxID=2715794 RepID=A0A858X8Z4_9BROM|nr:ORF2a [Actinidia yellowing ringspot virus]
MDFFRSFVSTHTDLSDSLLSRVDVSSPDGFYPIEVRDARDDFSHVSRFLGFILLADGLFSVEHGKEKPWWFYKECIEYRWREMFSLPPPIVEDSVTVCDEFMVDSVDYDYYRSEIYDFDDDTPLVPSSCDDEVQVVEFIPEPQLEDPIEIIPTVEVEAHLDWNIVDNVIPDVSSLTAQLDWKCLTMVAVENVLKNNEIPIHNSLKPLHTGCIQDAIDECFPHHHEIDDRYFQSMVETSDIDLELDAAKLDLSKFPKRLEIRFDWEPVISSGITTTRYNSFREAALAIKKRNLNVPNLTTSLDVRSLVPKVMKQFHKLFDLGKLVGFPDDFHDVGCFLLDYLKRKGLSYDSLEPSHMVAINKYRHMIKSQLKPVEEDSLHVERPLPATITYHGKEKVCVTTPFFLSLAAKLLLCLSDKVVIPMGKEHSLFDIDVHVFRRVSFWKEIDYSKFDKSQGELHHEIQKAIFEDLRCDNGFLNTWFHAHKSSSIFDSDAGIGFSTDFQRRTGDACTYLGNTLVTLATLAFVYDLDDPDVGLIVVSGDDSLIGTFERPLPRDKEHLCSTLFNFETKFPHNQPFICSKFLVEVETVEGSGKVIAVPSPTKLLMKLGTKIMSKHLFPAWAESIRDYAAPFKNAEVAEKACALAEYRFGRRKFKFLLPAIHDVIWLLQDNTRLKTLFFTNDRFKSDDCHDFKVNRDDRGKPRVRSKRK